MKDNKKIIEKGEQLAKDWQSQTIGSLIISLLMVGAVVATILLNK